MTYLGVLFQKIEAPQHRQRRSKTAVVLLKQQQLAFTSAGTVAQKKVNELVALVANEFMKLHF